MEFIIYDNANEVIKELSESLLNRHQIELGRSMRDDFDFDCLHLF